MNHRTCLRRLGAVSGSTLLPPLASCHSEPPDDGGVAAEFLHGVADGDPPADRVILWTRDGPVHFMSQGR